VPALRVPLAIAEYAADESHHDYRSRGDRCDESAATKRWLLAMAEARLSGCAATEHHRQRPIDGDLPTSSVLVWPLSFAKEMRRSPSLRIDV
jgi:hypothetical protein